MKSTNFSKNEKVKLYFAINLSGSVRLIQANYQFIGQTDSDDAYFAYMKEYKLNPDDEYLLPEKVTLKDLSNEFKGNFETINHLNKMIFVGLTSDDALSALIRYEEAKLHIVGAEVIRLQTIERDLEFTIESAKTILNKSNNKKDEIPEGMKNFFLDSRIF